MSLQRIPVAESVLPFKRMKGVPIGTVSQLDEGPGYVSVVFRVRQRQYSWYSWHVGKDKLDRHETRTHFVIPEELRAATGRALRSIDTVKRPQGEWYVLSDHPYRMWLMNYRRDQKNWRRYSNVKGTVTSCHHRVAHRALKLLRRAGFTVTVGGRDWFSVSNRLVPAVSPA
jgi:hypothetical protein